MASKGTSVTWTPRENKQFELALAQFDEDTPDRWQKIASIVGGGKTAEDMKHHYDLLVKDIEDIEAGRVPFPKYRPTSSRAGYSAANEEHEMRFLKLR